jgi:hypothetical protein
MFNVATLLINGVAAIVPAAFRLIVVFPFRRPKIVSAAWNVSPAAVPVVAKPLITAF